MSSSEPTSSDSPSALESNARASQPSPSFVRISNLDFALGTLQLLGAALSQPDALLETRQGRLQFEFAALETIHHRFELLESGFE